MPDDDVPECPGCSSPLCPDHPPAPRACSIDGCESPVRGRGWCLKHLTRLRRHGDPAVVLRGALRKDWTGDDVSYRAMHKRVVRERGPASAHRCIECSAPAEQWAVSHPRADVQRSQGGYTMPVSLDVAAYDPMCRSCHRQRDIAARAAAGDPIRTVRLAGVDNGNSRLTLDQVRELRAVPAGSVSVSELARRYGVSRRTIDRVVQGLSYTDCNPRGAR